MPELINLNHPGGEISRLGSERAEQIAQRLPQGEPSTTPPTEEAQEAIRAAATMANLTLFAWDALRQSLSKGAEGGQAREQVEETFRAIELWLKKIRIAIDLAERWHERIDSSLPLDELRRLEMKLQQAYGSAEQLRTLLNESPPVLPQAVLERVEAAGLPDDKTEYLDAEAFLARTRARKGA